jgi:hypothetical protein
LERDLHFYTHTEHIDQNSFCAQSTYTCALFRTHFLRSKLLDQDVSFFCGGGRQWRHQGRCQPEFRHSFSSLKIKGHMIKSKKKIDPNILFFLNRAPLPIVFCSVPDGRGVMLYMSFCWGLIMRCFNASRSNSKLLISCSIVNTCHPI